MRDDDWHAPWDVAKCRYRDTLWGGIHSWCCVFVIVRVNDPHTAEIPK